MAADLLEIRLEETGGFHVHTHSTEHNTEVVIVVIRHILTLHQTSLTSNLRANLQGRTAMTTQCGKRNQSRTQATNALRCVADQQQRTEESSDHGRWSSSHQSH